MTRPGRMYATRTQRPKSSSRSNPARIAYPTGEKHDVALEVTDELGTKGWVVLPELPAGQVAPGGGRGPTPAAAPPEIPPLKLEVFPSPSICRSALLSRVFRTSKAGSVTNLTAARQSRGRWTSPAGN